MEKLKSGESMRHLYLYTHMLLDEANKRGRKVRLVWDNIQTASIGPDPKDASALVLTLPEMAAEGTEEDAVLLRALISHEILCHGHHTDFSVKLDPGIGGVLENVLEDPRGELRAMRNFPGSNAVIHEGLRVLVKRGAYSGPPRRGEPPHPASVLVSWLVTDLRAELLGHTCLAEFAEQWRRLAVATFGLELVNAVKVKACEAAHSDSTQEVQRISREILALLKSAENPQESTAGESEGEAPADGQGTGGGEAPADGNSARAKAIADLLAASEDEAGEYASGLEGAIDKKSLPKLSRLERHRRISECPALRSGDPENRARHRERASSLAAALALKLEDLLIAKSTTRRTISDAGRLNPKRVARVAVGDLRVFENRSANEDLNTFVQLLVDESGSMKRPFAGVQTRESAATSVAVAVGEVLHNAEIPFALAGFNEQIREYKQAHESWPEVLQHYNPRSAGDTLTDQAIVNLLSKSVGDRESRKILLVITDGDPGNSHNLELALKEAAPLNVEVRFVLIGSVLTSYYEVGLKVPCSVANSPSELASAVFGSLESVFA